MSARRLLIVIPVVMLGCGGADTDPNVSLPPSRDRHATRATYAATAIKPLYLVEPVEIAAAGVTRDGHYYVQIRDSTDRRLYLSQVARRRGRESGFTFGSLTLRWGGGSETTAETGSELEAAVYGVLVRWAELHPLRREIRIMRKTSPEDRVLFFGHAFLTLMDWRFAPSIAVRTIQ